MEKNGKMYREKISIRWQQISLLAVFLLLSFSAVSAAGEADTTFNASITGPSAGYVSTSLVQPDGKIIIVGLFRAAEGEARTGIARYNADGSIDLGFNPPDLFNGWGYIGLNHNVALQSDGKIIVVGDIFGINGVQNNQRIIRLNTNGTLDTTFTPPPIGVAHFLAVYPNDKILVGVYNVGLTTLNADGTLDNTKQFPAFTNIGEILIQPDGKVLIAGTINNTTALYRFNENGLADNSFTPVPIYPSDLAVLPDGKIILVGGFTTFNGFPIPRGILRLNADGTLDSTFNQGGTAANSTVSSVAVTPNGKIIIGGSFTQYNGVMRNRLAVLNSDGSLDPGFNYTDTFQPNIYDLLYHPDGKIIVSAEFRAFRLNGDGSVDESFRTVITARGHGNRVRVQPDGKILVVGDFSYANNANRNYVARFNADGTLDNSFNPAFIRYSIGNGTITDVDVQSDGKILIVGTIPVTYSISERSALRLNPDGSLDLEFNIGSATFVKELPNGKIMMGTRMFNADGSPDDTFQLQVGGIINRIAAQPDGKIIIVGTFTTVNGQTRSRVARINADGSLDDTFNPSGGTNGTVRDVVRQADGKIVIAGEFTGVNFDLNKKYLARLNTDGSLDNSFVSPVNSPVSSVKLQADGKLLYNSANPAMGRLNPNGSADPTFSIGAGVVGGLINSIDIHHDNKILIAGSFIRVNGESAVNIARLLNNTTVRTRFDFEGDGKADLSIFRPSLGEWWYLRSSDGGNYAAQFGSASDRIVPADFTGDGRTDIAFWRPSTGEWFVLRSEDGSFYSFPFGTVGDIPTVGDFDADGRDDAAVFRPSNSTWYIFKSSGGTLIQQFGAGGDIPVAADYDGDGSADLAVFRPSTGEWWLNRTGAGLIVYQFGGSSDRLVPADYTGDGKTDVAFWRPSTGEWFVLRSENLTYYSFPFGTAGDVPVAADYDGDGRADAAVFRSSNSTWYIQRTTAGTLIQTFGAAGDVPVPSAFAP